MARSDTVSILDGDTFVVSDARGDVDSSPHEPHGLFHQDTRYLSRWLLTVDGRSPRLLSTDDVNYFSAQFFLVPPDGSVYEDSAFSIMRKRTVGDGFREELTVMNHTSAPLELELRLEAAADFADLFEVKDSLAKKGRHYQRVGDGRLTLGYARDGFVRETWITSRAAEGTAAEDGFRFLLRLEPHGTWTAALDVVVGVHAFGKGARRPGGNRATDRWLELDEWLEAAPRLSSDRRALELTYERSLADLAALRFYPPILPGLALPAAGLPWFMTVFGRDSLLTSYQALPYVPELADATLRVLAASQGTKIDDFRDEEPGKILHELRFGELTAFEERPHSPYYGTADATPLYLILLHETERWTGDAALVRQLERNARAALEWIDRYGDRDGDGYVEYERRNVESGLENQCWKDSWNSILFSDGTLAETPLATSEIQGYVYDAKLRTAHLARTFWDDPALAERLDAEAAELKRRFNEDFWLPEQEYFALALDGSKRRVDSLTSNIGHLLWSGIVDEDKAAAVVRHLMGDRLFSGWGVRTMAVGEGGYNPLGYHTGTVWPHDNSLIAAGLARYGYREEAARIASAMLEAAEFFRHRLPEVFAGYPRAQTHFPAEYPTACSPQAWASGTPLLLLTTVLGLQPRTFETNPHLPADVTRLALESTRQERTRVVPGPAAASVQPAIAASNGRPAGKPTAAELLERYEEWLDPARTRGEQARYRLEIVGVGTWTIDVDDGTIRVGSGDNGHVPDCALRLSEETFVDLVGGAKHAMTAFLTGALGIEGDLMTASKFDKYRRHEGRP